jgi:hypothetical protein
MRTRIPFLILLGLLTGCATASTDAIVSAGIGKDVAGDGPFERYGSLGIQYGDIWKVRGNGGYWFSPGGVSSSFGSFQGGLEVAGAGGGFASILFGPALITDEGGKLAGHLQFHLSGTAGVQDSNGYGIGLQWIHLSNAGIQSPNLGLDVWTACLLIPLGTSAI